MRTLAFTLLTVVGCLTVESASATTYSSYIIPGNNCTSITSLQTVSGVALAAPQYSKWGVNATAMPIDVTCPMFLPYQNYTYVYLSVNGYNRSSIDHVSCTISATDPSVSYISSVTAAMAQYVQSSWTGGVNSMNLSSNALLYLTCHLPAQTSSGSSHLSTIWLEFGY